MNETGAQAVCRRHLTMWQGNLSRLSNLLVVMNISMFFLSGLVDRGYFFTFFSLACLGAMGVATLIPTSLIDRLGYYLDVLAVELIGGYFLVASVVFWLQHANLPAMP